MGKRETRLPALTTLESIKEALDVRLGRRGDKLDKAVTFRDLEKSGAFRIGGAGGETELLTPDAPGSPDLDLDTWVPAAPTGFKATSMFGGIFLEWDWPPNFGAIGYTEIYRAQSNNAAERQLLTVGDRLTYFDAIDNYDTTEYFYWVRYRSLGNKVSPFAGPVSATVEPLVGEMIERLTGEISESLLAQTLRERIELIDQPGGLVDTVQEQGETFALKTDQLQVQLDADYAALQQQLSVEYNEATGRIESMWALRINSGGRISGFGLADDGNESVFGVEADRFYIGGQGAPDRLPFIVQDGEVYINSARIARGSIEEAVIRDAAITTAKIADASVDTIKISDAAIVTAKIKNAAIISAKIANAAITNAKIENAAITTAKIGDAQVDTLQIRGNAVTVPGGASGEYGAFVWMNFPEPTTVIVIGTFTQGLGRDGLHVYLTSTSHAEPLAAERPIEGTTGAMSKTIEVPAGSNKFEIYSQETGEMACGITVLGVLR